MEEYWFRSLYLWLLTCDHNLLDGSINWASLFFASVSFLDRMGIISTQSVQGYREDPMECVL